MVIAFAVIGIISFIVGFTFLMDDYTPGRGLLGMIFGVLLVCGGLFQYHYMVMHSDPANVYTDIDTIDDGNNVVLIVNHSVPIIYQPDVCEKVSSFTVGEEDITSYLGKMQKAYNK
jgi:membrane-bound ClpP family serine protease